MTYKMRSSVKSEDERGEVGSLKRKLTTYKILGSRKPNKKHREDRTGKAE